MSTCPHCKGHLTDHHHCPRRPAIVLTEMGLAAIGGGLGGLVLVAALDPRGQFTSLDSISILAGMSVGIGIDRLLRS